MPWLVLSVCVAVVAAGLGLVAYAAFALPGPVGGAAPQRDGLTERAIAFVLALVVPIAGMVGVWACDAAARFPSHRERRPPLSVPLLALALALGAAAGWAVVFAA